MEGVLLQYITRIVDETHRYIVAFDFPWYGIYIILSTTMHEKLNNALLYRDVTMNQAGQIYSRLPL